MRALPAGARSEDSSAGDVPPGFWCEVADPFG
jgi:hypothetical protein